MSCFRSTACNSSISFSWAAQYWRNLDSSCSSASRMWRSCRSFRSDWTLTDNIISKNRIECVSQSHHKSINYVDFEYRSVQYLLYKLICSSSDITSHVLSFASTYCKYEYKTFNKDILIITFIYVVIKHVLYIYYNKTLVLL